MENEAFIKFVRLLEPNYKVPSRQSLRGIVIDEASEVMKKVCFCVQFLFIAYPSIHFHLRI